MFSEKADPQNLDAELAVLGACLMSAVGRATCVQLLKAEDFYADKHRLIFTTLCELDAAGPVSLIQATDRLAAKGLLDEIGGVVYLTTCINACPTPNVPEAMVYLVLEKSHRRRLLRGLREGQDLARDQLRPIGDVQAEAERLVLSARKPAKGTVTAEEWADQFEVDCAMTAAGQEPRRRILTGIDNLDVHLNCWPGRLTTVGGDTGIGKSVFTVKVAREGALRKGQRVYCWLGEMDKGEFYERTCAAELGLDYGAIQRRRTPPRDAKRVAEWMKDTLTQAPLIVRDTDDGIMTVADIRADCRYITHKQGRIDAIVIDYLMLLGDLNSEVEGSDRRDVRIGRLVWELILMARELECHIFLVHQFNRTKSARSTGRPRLSDLKESSAIEQHSYNVLLLYRPDSDESLEPQERDAYRGWFEANIAKARGGRKGNVWMEFDGTRQELKVKPPPWPGDKGGLPWPGTLSEEIRAERRKRERGGR